MKPGSPSLRTLRFLGRLRHKDAVAPPAWRLLRPSLVVALLAILSLAPRLAAPLPPLPPQAAAWLVVGMLFTLALDDLLRHRRHGHQVRAEAARRQLAERQMQELIAGSTDWYWQTDARHHLVRLDAHGADGDALLADGIGRPWWQLPPGSGPAGADQTVLQRRFEGRQAFRRLIVEVGDGTRPSRWLALSGTPRFGEHGRFIGHHGIALDVTDELHGKERSRHLAYHDPLTGLPNRRLLTDRLTQAIMRAQRYRERIGVILLELDDFPRLTALGGQAAAEQALRETAERLRNGLRSCDTVGRLAGETFVVLLTEIELPFEADQVAAKILHTLAQPLGSSIGLAIFPDDARSAESLLEVADRRMVRARRRGGQRIERT